MSGRAALPPELAALRIVRAGFVAGCLSAVLEDGRLLRVVFTIAGRAAYWTFTPAVAHA